MVPPPLEVYPAQEPREDDHRIIAVEEIFRVLMRAIKSLTIYACPEHVPGPLRGRDKHPEHVPATLDSGCT